MAVVFLVGTCRCFEESNLRRCFMSQSIVQSMGAVGAFQCVGNLVWEPCGMISVMVSWGVACLKKTPYVLYTHKLHVYMYGISSYIYHV